jgi:hypothetical protein
LLREVSEYKKYIEKAVIKEKKTPQAYADRDAL